MSIPVWKLTKKELKIKTPTSWNWTSDRRITAKLYSPSLYQLSYCRNLTILIILSINWIPSPTSFFFYLSFLSISSVLIIFKNTKYIQNISFYHCYCPYTQCWFLFTNDHTPEYFWIWKFLYTYLLISFHFNLYAIIGMYGFTVLLQYCTSLGIVFTVDLSYSSCCFIRSNIDHHWCSLKDRHFQLECHGVHDKSLRDRHRKCKRRQNITIFNGLEVCLVDKLY